MRLYHVTTDLTGPREKEFIPRVPESTGAGENKTISRICMADSIEHCIQAMPAHGNLREGLNIRVYYADVDVFITPDQLFRLGLVPDALENQEYWVTESIVMKSHDYVVDSFSYVHDVGWSCITRNRVVDIMSDVCPEYSKVVGKAVKDSENSHGLYDAVARVLNECEDYDKLDDLWESLVMEPWLQVTRISNVSLTETTPAKELDVSEDFFDLMALGTRNFDIRRRGDYCVGDKIKYKEICGEQYTGKEFEVSIKYVQPWYPKSGMLNGYCILSW